MHRIAYQILLTHESEETAMAFKASKTSHNLRTKHYFINSQIDPRKHRTCYHWTPERNYSIIYEQYYHHALTIIFFWTGNPAECFNNAEFGCCGTAVVRGSGPECCDDGFLSFSTLGADVCQLCSGKTYKFSPHFFYLALSFVHTGNVICSAAPNCTDLFDPSQAHQSSVECCATGGGVAYTDSTGICLVCEYLPRLPTILPHIMWISSFRLSLIQANILNYRSHCHHRLL